MLLILLLGVAAALRRDLRRNHRGPQPVALAALGPRHHFSMVRVVGRLVADVAPLGDDGCFFRISNGNGSAVDVFFDQAPRTRYRAGTRVAATGRLVPAPDGSSRLNARFVEPAPQLIRGLRPDAECCLLAELDDTDIGRIVTVAGRVARVEVPAAGSRAPYRVLLDDGSGRLPLVHWLGDAAGCAQGDMIRVRGTVSVFRGRLELKVQDAADLTVTGSTSAASPTTLHGN